LRHGRSGTEGGAGNFEDGVEESAEDQLIEHSKFQTPSDDRGSFNFGIWDLDLEPGI
jgi:hypothetical protein